MVALLEKIRGRMMADKSELLGKTGGQICFTVNPQQKTGALRVRKCPAILMNVQSGCINKNLMSSGCCGSRL